MARPYSVDLRQRAVSAAESAPVRAAGARFGVSASAVVKWGQRLSATGDVGPSPVGGSKPRVLVGERDWLLARIAEKPDLTLRAIMAELAERGTVVSYHAVRDFFLREGVTFKKKPARGRTGPSGRGEETGAMEALSGMD
jgi:transposase